ncbi:DUF2961 domain-containing protein [Candidatus Sumerlaeota bacterium]|nr:DUF2961 domain-containing protein [Candidatus Sumerlaeota bacterium]
MLRFVSLVLITLCFVSTIPVSAQTHDLHRKPKGAYTRWASFENPAGEKGLGGMTNDAAKGAAFMPLDAGESKTLLNVKGSGTITRMWFTVNDRTTDTLRSLKLDIYWDDAGTPGVSVPFGDFFGVMGEEPVAFESALFSNPEARSFNCYIPMPFRKSARLVMTNETGTKLRLLFYDIDYILNVKHEKDALYFHACWRREKPTALRKDFEILPKVKGAGRFLGANIFVSANPIYTGWWGEGEVKMFLDGDAIFPTIVGTGTEDYIGTGWGQNKFSHAYQGCLVCNEKKGRYMFYRYHVPDPVYFDKDIRVTIQQMGGDSKAKVIEMQKKGVPLVPVSVAYHDRFIRLFDLPQPVNLEQHDSPMGSWTNYFRQDDVCAVAYFYLDKPENGLRPLAPAPERTIAPY